MFNRLIRYASLIGLVSSKCSVGLVEIYYQINQRFYVFQRPSFSAVKKLQRSRENEIRRDESQSTFQQQTINNKPKTT